MHLNQIAKQTKAPAESFDASEFRLLVRMRNSFGRDDKSTMVIS
ncbi:hypothetical protein MADA3029_220002 [Vibrio nigripulchritudo MADA3029]|nr:hypothetical protein VIBNIMADA3020_390010 [Vibrio nigripulchritudo MADA3020]CCN56282.1 hypothetical protein VIBNIMADA3021_920002 [Vibrio nigripulchritudo MADA3021]CCN58630.1 hypothetical protein MADA3029_220002 [Vibrio nigripulchritudo MADA3029]